MSGTRSLAFQDAPKRRRCFHCNELFTKSHDTMIAAIVCERKTGLLGSVMLHVHCYDPFHNGMPGVRDLRQVQFFGPRATIENIDEFLSVADEIAEALGGVPVPVVRPAVH